MDTYLIGLPYPSEMNHWEGQTFHARLFEQAGIPYDARKWHSGWSKDNIRMHDWKLQCSEQQLTFMSLSRGIVIKENLTKKFRASGLAKLTIDEKLALGLQWDA